MSAPAPLVRIGILGDIHCEHVALEAALATLEREGVQQVLAVGDLVDGVVEGEGDLDRCCALLEDAGVQAVAGNHDRWFLERSRKGAIPACSEATRSYLASLPRTREYLTARGPLQLCHGVGANDMQRLNPFDEGYALEANDALQQLLRAGYHRFLVGGHTHRRMVRTFGQLTVINPGTLLRTHQPCFALADLSAGHVRFFNLTANAQVLPAEQVPLPLA